MQNPSEPRIPHVIPCFLDVQRAQKHCLARSWRRGRASARSPHTHLNAPKSCDLVCARDAHRRSDKASIVRSAPPGPPTGRSATHKRTPRPELATLSGLRAAWRASSSRSESCRPRSAARFLRHRVQRSRGVRPGEYTGRVTCAIAPGLVAAFRLWSARRADRVYRAHSPYQEMMDRCHAVTCEPAPPRKR